MEVVPSVIKMVGPFDEVSLAEEVDTADPKDEETALEILKANEIKLADITKDYEIINQKDSDGKTTTDRLHDKE